MKAYSILVCALCACVFVAGCGDKEKEKADLAKVVQIREALAKQGEALKEHIDLLKATEGSSYKDIMVMQVDADRIKNALAKPIDVKDLEKLSSLANATSDALDKLQAEIDRRTEILHKANEAAREAAERVRKFDEEHGL